MSDEPLPLVLDPTQNLVFVDIETFGLDFVNDEPIEVGMAITDRDLNILEIERWFVWEEWYDHLIETQLPMQIAEGRTEYEWVLNQHAKSGLFKEAKAVGKRIDHTESDIIEWLDDNGFPRNRTMPMCGSSVNFDRIVASFNFPQIFVDFHYRVIDVSTFKMAAKIWHPELDDLKKEKAPQPREAHRVLPDLEDSINELSFYVDHFLVTTR